MADLIQAVSPRSLPLPRRLALQEVAAPWSAPADRYETGMAAEPFLPFLDAESTPPDPRKQRWVGVGLAVGASLLGVVGVLVPAVGWSAEPAPESSISALRPGTDPLDGLLIAGGGPAAPTARRYPAIGAQRGDYVAHGVNFSHLISDDELTDADALNVDQIQAYLTARGSFLASFKENGRSASQIIVDAARRSQINPRVILATLEKETSLVSRHKAPHWVLRSAMGYAYDDGGSTAGRHSTFTSQVDGGTKLLRDSYDQGRALSYPRRFRVDYGHRTIHVDNAATYALMTYTPHTTDTHLRHVGGGNHLFANTLRRMHLIEAEVKAAPVATREG